MVLQNDQDLFNVLKSLVPISNLSQDKIELVAESSSIQTVSNDQTIFKEGDSDDFAYYLLEGELELISTNNTNFHIVSNTDDARYPLAQFQPRQYTAKAIVDSQILILDRNLLDSLLVGNRSEDSYSHNGLEVSDLDNENNEDWMTRILQSPLFTSISVENIQKIFARIESIDVSKGDIIVKQGDDGDYYYIIQQGKCKISRRPSEGAQDITLTELREGDTFGEEGIISNLKRNASVTMLTDGRLMRLTKNNFRELILNPILKKIDLDSAQDMVKQGAVWLDVRYPDEHQDFSIEGSMNIPLNLLRVQVKKLDERKIYITCCDTGARSAIAAYVLAQYGCDVYQLNIGLKHLFRRSEPRQPEPKIIEKNISTSSSSADILPFKKDTNDEIVGKIHVLNVEFQDEINQLRKELDTVRNQFQELLKFKNMATDLKKSVMDATEEKLKDQRERITIQTRNTNKLILQAQKMQSELEQEKRQIYKEVEKHRKEQEEAMLHIQDEINKRLLEEEKKMQAFYSWKANEIEKIKQMKKEAEQEYLANRLKKEMQKNEREISTQFEKLESIKQDMQDYQDQEDVMSKDLREWLAEQVTNDMSPINKEIAIAKRKLIEEANKRSERSKQMSRAHDQALTSEIDSLLRNSEN